MSSAEQSSPPTTGSSIKDLTAWAPLRLLLWGALGSIFVGLQNMLQLAFACPCHIDHNLWFGILFFLLPGLAFSILNVLTWKWKRWRWGQISCSQFAGLSSRRFLSQLFFPLLMWATAVFLNGDAVACMTTHLCSDIESPDLIVCRVKDDHSTDAEERCYRYWSFVSKLIGLAMLVFLVFAGLALKFSYKCGKDCSCWEVDWKINYKEEALRHNENILMEVLLDRTKDDTKKKLTAALECKEGFWAQAEDICKDVRCPEDDEPIE
ncbi:uncharacterized protein LOC144754004 [Lissotriton helveticus]